MSNLKVQASLTGTGVVTLMPPTTNTDRTVTLPDQTGTVYITGGDIGTPSAGNGSNLTNLNASNLSSGTVPDARFPATLPAASGANLTALNASNLGSGTVPDARFPATLPTASGANLTNLNASNLSTGTIPTGILAVTQAAKTSDTTIATTAFVDRLRSLLTATTGSGGGTAVIGDRGCLLSVTAGVTVPANVFAANDTFSIYNNSSGNITITQGASLTLRQVGTANTGNRTLAQRGLVTVVFISATEAVISGGGLT